MWLTFFSFFSGATGQVVNPAKANLSTSTGFFYKLQRYTGVNFLTDCLSEGIIKFLVKVKTQAKKVKVELEIFSGFDLLRKKVKSLRITANELYIKLIPVDYFELNIKEPIFLRSLWKMKVKSELYCDLLIKINLEDITRVLNGLPKWKKVLNEIDLPIPPFGTTKISVRDLNVRILDNGNTQVNASLSSLINTESEPINLLFSGNLAINDKKIVVEDLISEAEGIFTKDSDIGLEFSKFLQDLINPIIDFSKYEKRNCKIDFVNLYFKNNVLILKINLRLVSDNDK